MVETPKASPADALSRLTHCRWALPVLTEVAKDGGAKLVTLSRRLGASPAGVKRALQRLHALGLVIPNPGYGHPLRPEYILGPVGEQVGELPATILRWTEQQERAADALKKWHLPVLVAVDPATSRFNEVRTQLPVATPRAVAMALKSNAALGLIVREIEDGYPPVPLYAPTKIGADGREPAMVLGEILVESTRDAPVL